MKSDVHDAALSEAERRREEGRRVRVHCKRASVYVFVCMHAYVLMCGCVSVPEEVKNLSTALRRVKGCMVVYGFRFEQSNTWASI